MFGVSLPELVVIFVVVLLVFGPDKLPEIARLLGKTSGELRRASDGMRREFYKAVYEPSKAEVDAAQRVLTSVKNAPPVRVEPDPLCSDYKPPPIDSEAPPIATDVTNASQAADPAPEGNKK